MRPVSVPRLTSASVSVKELATRPIVICARQRDRRSSRIMASVESSSVHELQTVPTARTYTRLIILVERQAIDEGRYREEVRDLTWPGNEMRV